MTKYQDFYGWIDVRDLKNEIKLKEDGNFYKRNRHLIVWDKHWYDGKLRKIKITVLDEIK